MGWWSKTLRIASKLVVSLREKHIFIVSLVIQPIYTLYIFVLCAKYSLFTAFPYKFAFTSFHSTTILNHGLIGVINAQKKKQKTSRSHMSGIFTTIASKPKRTSGKKSHASPGWLTSSPSPSSVFAKSWPLIGWLLLVLNPGTFRPLPAPETNRIAPERWDGWKKILSFWG